MTQSHRNRLRGASLLVIATALYIAAVTGSLYVLETAYYNPAKRELIARYLDEGKYIDFDAATQASSVLKQYAYRRAQGQSREQLEPLRQQGRKAMEALLNSSPTAVRAVLEDTAGNTLIEVARPGRLEENHDWSNRLLTGDFIRETRQSFQDQNLNPIGRFRLSMTTAKNNSDIETLTTKYRWFMIGSVLLLTLIYYLLMRLVLLPLSRVLNYMQFKGRKSSPIIPSPKSPLERAYNNLARDAALTRLSKDLREYISSEGLSHIEPVLDRVPETVRQIVGTARQIAGASECQVWIFVSDDDNLHWHAEKCFREPDAGEEAQRAAFEKLVEERLHQYPPSEDESRWRRQIISPERGGVDPFFCDVVSSTEGRLLMLVIRGTTSHPNDWWTDLYSRIAQELRYAINSVAEQRRMILQEKSKANISLSRNLGHDLTNIIATSKLELMTVRAFLSLDAEQVKESPEKEKLFKESLEALLNNTRFLQEIVNLYRSFSYLQKPKFETVCLTELVHDVCELYQLSISTSIKIKEELADHLPETRVEPRLLRLALFNLLTNAADAIKRATSAESPEGTITIYTKHDKKHGRLEIRVADTGTGICDEEGNLLSPETLSDIFHLGFSTKANQEGEGLGLNWVQTIVREFHRGDISASNRPEGGAQFAIRLPIVKESDEEPVRPSPPPAELDKPHLQKV